MPPKSSPVVQRVVQSPSKPAGPTAAGNGKFNIVLSVKQIFVFKEAIKQAKEAGIFTDKEQKKISEKNQKVVEMKKALAKDLMTVTSSRKGKTTPVTVEDSEALDTLQDFFEGLIVETDNIPGNIDLVKAFLTCVGLDYPALCESRGLVTAAVQDGSLLYLTEFMTFSSPTRLKLDPLELFSAAFYNQQFRIPLVSLLLKHEASFGESLKEAAKELTEPWNEFIADIAAKKRAIAREDRNNRMPLLLQMMTHPIVKYNCELEGGDGHTVFSRACAESDLPLLEMLVKNSLHPNVNRLNGDGRSALMHAVIANSLDVVRFLLKIEGIDAHVVAKSADEGSAMDFAKLLKRDVAIVTALGGALKRCQQQPADHGDDPPGVSPLKRRQSIAKMVDLQLDVESTAKSAVSPATRFKMLGPLVNDDGAEAAAGGVRLPLLNRLASIRVKDAAQQPNTARLPASTTGFKTSHSGDLSSTSNLHSGTVTFNAMSLRGLAGTLSSSFDPIKPGPNQKLLNEAKFDLATGKFHSSMRVVDKEPVKPQAAAPSLGSPRLAALSATPSQSPPSGSKTASKDHHMQRSNGVQPLHSPQPPPPPPPLAHGPSLFPPAQPSQSDVMTLVRSILARKSIATHRASIGIVTEDESKKQDQRLNTISHDYAQLADVIFKNYSKTNIYVPPEDDDYLQLQEFLTGLIGDGDNDPARAHLVHMLIERCELDISIVSDMNALVATAAGDGSVAFLKPLLEHPDTKFDPAEALLNAMFNQTMRIPTVLTLLHFPHRMEFSRLKQDKHVVAAWNEFFADIACRKRAFPNEDRSGRMELLGLMLANPVLAADPSHIDSDQLDVFCRAAHDGDVEVLQLLRKMKAMPANINAVYADGTTILIHAVFSGDASTVDFVLGLPNIDVNVETENGTALGVARGLHRPKSLTQLLEARGATAGMTASRIMHVPELAMSVRSKTARSLWEEAMDDDDDCG
jgi:ankyrin repeat protein